MRVLAFDIGLKRTGVASGHVQMKTAEPAGQIAVKDGHHDWQALDKLIKQWEPEQIVVGDPKTNNPHLNKAINRFISRIQQQYKIEIVRVDERLTSTQANQALVGLSEKKKTTLRDQVAAMLILQSYFNEG